MIKLIDVQSLVTRFIAYLPNVVSALALLLIFYKEDMKRARDIMLETVKGDDRILQDPSPNVIVTDLGESSVNMQLRFWTEDPLLKFNLMWEYTEKCKQAMDDAGIEIPFPHMQLFLEKTEGLQLLDSGKSTED